MSDSNALCHGHDSVLVAIDIQGRLASAMPAADLEPFMQSTSVLLRAAVHLDIPILATEQYPQGLGETLPEIRQHYPASASCMAKTGFSCCAADGSCTETLAIDCAGDWTMFGVCDPNPCPQPMGACCYEDGSCVETLLVDCNGV